MRFDSGRPFGVVFLSEPGFLPGSPSSCKRNWRLIVFCLMTPLNPELMEQVDRKGLKK